VTAVGETKHVYDYDVDPESDSAPARVVRMVGQGKRVLEIGAGPGSITRVLAERKNRVTALEVDETALPFLKKHVEDVVAADLNRADWPSKFGGARFDAVIAADVLEHLVDPWSTLSRMTTLLAPGGSVILSVPHASHATILMCLLLEDVEYRDWGLLDRTHIRFFGLHNLESMVRAAGLKIVRGEFVVRDPRDTEFASKWATLPFATRRFLGRQPFAQVYQVVVRCVREEDPRPAVSLLALDPADFGAKPIEPTWLEKKFPRASSLAEKAIVTARRRGGAGGA
jgi:2-polyprenyl-3-methyl-5-hydroxy-6-metoxy-1,4-benzoquinol methylase